MSHEYPGINIDLRHFPHTDQMYPIGAHYNCWGAESEILPIREVFMMMLMDRLTDKVDWHKKVLDDEIVTKWRKEALEQSEDGLYLQVIEGRLAELPQPRERIISEATFDYCIKELREKASHFEKTGLVHTLDSVGNTVVKSDTVVPSQLQNNLRTAFIQLSSDQESDVDWHPRSNEMVQDLVHPSMYPFIYGRSNFLQEEVVGVSNAVEVWAGKGEIALEPREDDPDLQVHSGGIGGSIVPPEYWSTKYQWLPANLTFQENGTVKFTSYINNLHPGKYPEIYRTIEKLVDIAIPAWDQCLSRYGQYGAGRKNSRFSLPEYYEDENDRPWEPFNTEVLEKYDIELSQEDLDNIEYEKKHGGQIDGQSDSERIQIFKWDKYVRDPILPEPDDETEVDYVCQERLREKFKASGLQVIVKMATIELTPEKPEFPMGGWHIEGQMNERICATALYYLDSENVTPSHLSFRMRTSYEQDSMQEIAGQDQYKWLERVYGTGLSGYSGNSCLQNYGSVETRQGRLLAFPNSFQHRVSSFKLQDPTKPGYRRFIALWLVDPHLRIVSTANVPPQQLDWWAEAVFGADEQANLSDMPPEIFQLLLEQGLSKKYPTGDSSQAKGRKMPPEILDILRQHETLHKGLMSVEEAKQHRLELINIRSRYHETSEKSWQSVDYSFCEH